MNHWSYGIPGDIIMQPVGMVKNGMKEPSLVAGKNGLTLKGNHETILDRVKRTRSEISEIIIRENLDDLLTGIEEYSHLVVLYWAHAVPENYRSLTRVHPMGRKDLPEVGIFSTCSPARPNSILMTVVRLIRRRGHVLEVAGLDAIDGSPVLDIKPYVSEFFPREGVRIPAWMQQIQNDIGKAGR
ncbi:MAG: tRNA (N6-threonylcarbamoyladenosine(37)-N6)-methyltransferase TrmO [Methanomicrobiales archaeon]|nr:tRNA (N6-threonylcarbamoyladenosine(37)-N6)-methyltransferase TrmO [Methanomicrobiales archaeon]